MVKHHSNIRIFYIIWKQLWKPAVLIATVSNITAGLISEPVRLGARSSECSGGRDAQWPRGPIGGSRLVHFWVGKGKSRCCRWVPDWYYNFEWTIVSIVDLTIRPGSQLGSNPRSQKELQTLFHDAIWVWMRMEWRENNSKVSFPHRRLDFLLLWTWGASFDQAAGSAVSGTVGQQGWLYSPMMADNKDRDDCSPECHIYIHF